MPETQQKHVEKAWAVVIGSPGNRYFMVDDELVGIALFDQQDDAAVARDSVRRSHDRCGSKPSAFIKRVEIREL